MKRLLILEILILLIIVVLNVMNYITYGLGDVYIVLIFSVLLMWLIHKIAKLNIKLTIAIYFLLLILIIFKITLYRGVKYKWNGNILYNNFHTIKSQNYTGVKEQEIYWFHPDH